VMKLFAGMGPDFVQHPPEIDQPPDTDGRAPNS
jgi:hypothetical protein